MIRGLGMGLQRYSLITDWTDFSRIDMIITCVRLFAHAYKGCNSNFRI